MHHSERQIIDALNYVSPAERVARVIGRLVGISVTISFYVAVALLAFKVLKPIIL